MLSKADFATRMLDGGCDRPGEDTRFARRLLEASALGHGQTRARGELLRGELLHGELLHGDRRTARFLPDAAVYWPKTPERRHHTLLFELDTPASAILADARFRTDDPLEDVLHVIVQDTLEAFERESRGRQRDALCVVSVVDDRRGEGGRRLACFGTRSTVTGAVESFTIREEAPGPAHSDPALARAYLEQVYQRHVRRLAAGARWQDAFISGAEQRDADGLLAACSVPIDAGELQRRLAALFEEIAGSLGFGVDGNRRLFEHRLPGDHRIARAPEAARARNPLQGLRYFDADRRLVGYCVYVADPDDAEQVRADFTAHNRFHDVLVIYPAATADAVEIELWQGDRPVRGRLLGGGRRGRASGPGRVVQVISRFLVISANQIDKPATLAAELAWRARRLCARAVDALRTERERPADARPLRDLLDAFDAALGTFDDGEFADAYAQTITYGLLAARWLDPERGRRIFVRQTAAGLFPRTSPVLRAIARQLVDARFDLGLVWLLDDITGLLARTRVEYVFRDAADPAMHFYEDFLDAYDPRIRRQRGVYYTPDEVVSYIVRTTDAALRERFGLPLGLADTTRWLAFAEANDIDVPDGIDADAPFVQILDPATGTGTFLLRVIQVIHETMQARYTAQGLDDAARQTAWRAYVRDLLLPRINGLEIMVAPYVICHLRIGLALEQTGFEFEDPRDVLEVRLTDALQMEPAQPGHPRSALAAEADAAERIKVTAPISVIVGNPPYERESAGSEGGHKGGWVRDGMPALLAGAAPLDAFTEAVRQRGAGSHLKSVYNLYVYFWRWAVWRVFEQRSLTGIISLISASSYLRGPGFGGMREYFRRRCERVFILDLEGDQKGARQTENVFDIQIPVAVTTLEARPSTEADQPADAGYHRVEGTRREKLALCGSVRSLGDLRWEPVSSRWHDALVGRGDGSYGSWPDIRELLPWHHSGAQFKRKWVIAEAGSTLRARWSAFVASPDRADAFHETRDRTVRKSVANLFRPGTKDAPLASVDRADEPCVMRYGYRSFDRQYVLADNRLGDFIRPCLWQTLSGEQVYMGSLLTKVLGVGPAAVASAYVPDMDFFCNRGGKDVIPLWRDPAGTRPNLARGFHDALTAAYGERPAPEDVFAYAYAVLANPGYVERFTDELQVPGPRLPVTKDPALFAAGAAMGRLLLRWHTYGERFCDDALFGLTGSASVIEAIPGTPAGYPERHRYDAETGRLHVGDGVVGPVSAEVWGFSVSGLHVVKSWLDYRMKKGAGRKSSPLDDIRPERWTDEMTAELLALTWVLEWTLAQYPGLDAWLDAVLAGALFTADEIPPPTAAERKPPGVERPGSSGSPSLPS